MQWQLLITSLSGPKSAARMRLWRAMKAVGAAVLRDGVYLLPEGEAARSQFEEQAEAIRGEGDTAYCFSFTAGQEEAGLRELFDRSGEYAGLLRDLADLRAALAQLDELTARRRLLQAHKSFDAIASTDFFPGTARSDAEAALLLLLAELDTRFSPQEPTAVAAAIPRHAKADFLGRLWATRARPWVDRLACAWLIRRFIDPQARFLWLASPADCPAEAIGFDFDGAVFTHVGDKVSFEVLLEGFGLERDPVLRRIAALVHYLDVGGIPVAEAEGLVMLLAGARARQGDDDALVTEASLLFDQLHAACSSSEKTS